MEHKFRNLKTPAIVAAAALAVILLLIGIFVNSVQKGKRETIELPESTSQPEQTAGSSAAAEEDFAEVTPDNVQSVLQSLSRPSSYHQINSVTTTADAAEKTVTAEIWVSGSKMRAEITDGSEVKTILTDGKTLYIWYNDDQKPVSMELSPDMTTDDLTGIPTYESLEKLPKSAISNAEFVTLEDEKNLECVFVDSISGKQQQYDWVSLDSGLLYKQTTLQDGVQLYAMQETKLEILADSDESLSDVFLLPDQTDPFSK